MRNLIQFILRNHFFILFLIIEAVSISILVQYNTFQQTQFANYSSAVSGYFHEQVHFINEYFNLKETNKQLINENRRLRNELAKLKQSKNLVPQKDKFLDKSSPYTYIAAQIVNNSTNKQFNYITINKGRTDSVYPEMGVVSENGAVGIVKGVSKHFAIVIPVLNRNFQLSAAIKKNNYYGSISWNGEDYRFVSLNDVPYHVPIAKGDTVITSGYSAIFPKGITVGYIDSYNKGGNFYNIRVRLATNFKNLAYVYIIRNKYRQERKEIENRLMK